MNPEPDSPSPAVEADLQRRLAEAEDTLRAIREGEVDALVVRGAADDEVYALGGADSYRAFMEAMDIGAAALDAGGKLLYANGTLRELLGVGTGDLQQSKLLERLGSSGSLMIRRMLEEAGDQRRSEQLTVQTASGERYIEVTSAPLDLAFGRGLALTFTDVTERVESSAASESERIGRALLASLNEAVVVCNERGVITQANAKVRQLHSDRTVGLRFDEAFEIAFPVTAGLIGSRDLVDLALSGSSARALEGALTVGGSTRTVLVSSAPLRSAGETVGGCIIAMDDITEQKAVERKQRLLMSELTHRVKNTLTLVLSIANRTASGSHNLGEFRTAFGRRLEALAATHNLLAEDFSTGLTLEEIAVAELTPYVAPGSDRLRLEELGYRLTSDVAVTFGLIIHELVTNAVKYGALSNDRGCVSLTAKTQANAVEIVWQEADGPPVLQPERQGFGQTLILRGLGQTGPLATTLEYKREGVICRMYLPLDSVTATADEQLS